MRKEERKLKNKRHWTNQEDAIIRERYRGDNRCWATIEALAVLFDRNPFSVRSRMIRLGLPARRPRWNQADLDYLHDNYGRRSAAVIGKRLGRSTNALKIISFRRLNGLDQRSNIYTARAAADALGLT